MIELGQNQTKARERRNDLSIDNKEVEEENPYQNHNTNIDRGGGNNLSGG